MAEDTRNSRCLRIAEIVSEGIHSPDIYPPDVFREIYEADVTKVMKAIGITRADGSCDQVLAEQFCNRYADDPHACYYGLHFLSSGCCGGDGADPYECEDCPINQFCSSYSDPWDYPEECGE